MGRRSEIRVYESFIHKEIGVYESVITFRDVGFVRTWIYIIFNFDF